MKRTFPARISISVETAKQNTVLSNMPALLEQPFGPDQKIVVFAETPSIACDTIFLASGKLEWLDDEAAGVKLRIATAPGKKESAKYAMEVTRQLLPFLNNYFAVPFPLPELDQIALPVRRERRPERTAAKSFMPRTHCYAIRTTGYESARQRIFLAVAHQIARQWFGNFVTTTQGKIPGWMKVSRRGWQKKPPTISTRSGKSGCTLRFRKTWR